MVQVSFSLSILLCNESTAGFVLNLERGTVSNTLDMGLRDSPWDSLVLFSKILRHSQGFGGQIISGEYENLEHTFFLVCGGGGGCTGVQTNFYHYFNSCFIEQDT